MPIFQATSSKTTHLCCKNEVCELFARCLLGAVVASVVSVKLKNQDGG